MRNSKHTIITMSKTTFTSKFLFVFLIFCVSSYKTFGQNIQGDELNNNIRISFTPVSMPTNLYPTLKPTMGLAGLHYQVPINNWLYTGAGMKFAVTGDQGGLFTLGVELGTNQKLVNNLYLDANVHFGGGGGYRYLINSGGFINPNIGLKYKQKGYSFGVQYSHIDFYSGKIKDNTLSFFIEIPSIFRFTNYDKAHQNIDIASISSEIFTSKPAIKNVQQIRFDFFRPFGNSKRDNKKKLDGTLYVLGFEYQKYINENTFLFVHTDAIYKGLRAGFMDLFVGAGHHPFQSKYVNFFGKLAIGGAGGRVAPEGGLMIYPSAGIDLKLSDNISLSGHGGYYRAIAGDLEAYTYGFGIKYLGLNGGTTTTNKNYKTAYLQGLRVEVANQSYIGVAKTDDIYKAKKVDLQLIGLKFNFDIYKWLYIAGEAGFAYSGRSGGYAHGLVGAGIYSPKFFNKTTRVFAECMAGAGGGAGVDTDEGIITRPTLGLSYDLDDKFSIFISGGRYYSPFGNVNANNLNIGLSFNLSTLSLKR